MLTEARKLYLIEEVLKTDNEQTLSALEAVLKKSHSQESVSKSPLSALSSIWSKEEAREIEKAIAENCKQIDPDDWK